MITVNNIERGIDYKEFYMYISCFLHEIKSYGVQTFLKFYKDNLNSCKTDMNNVEFRVLNSFIMLHDKSYKTCADFDKYILGVDDYDRIFNEGKPVNLAEIEEKSLKSFLSNGILLKKLDKVVGT